MELNQSHEDSVSKQLKELSGLWKPLTIIFPLESKQFYNLNVSKMKVLCSMNIPKYLYGHVWCPKTEEPLHHVRERTGRSAAVQNQFTPAVDDVEFPEA